MKDNHYLVLAELRVLAEDIAYQHAENKTLTERVELFRNLANDFREDVDDQFLFDNAVLIAEEKLFPPTFICQHCDCPHPMSVCAIKCPIYRKYHK